MLYQWGSSNIASFLLEKSYPYFKDDWSQAEAATPMIFTLTRTQLL